MSIWAAGLVAALAMNTAQADRVTNGVLALYQFDDGRGDRVSDTSGAVPPLDLVIQETNSVTWFPGGGLLVNETTLASETGATNLVLACAAAGQFAVELWMSPANLLQGDPVGGSPSIIFTLSQNASARNFSIEQQGQLYLTRVRTTSTASSGTPGVQGPVSLSLTHLVVTFDAAGTTRLYINGVLAGTQAVGGALTGWNPAYPLVLANETTGGADWFGQLYLVAMYDHALSPAEVAQNFNAGTSGGISLPPIIVIQPESVAVDEPQSAAFRVAAGGTQPLHYQWRRNGVALTGQNEAEYILNPTVYADDGAAFDVVISNAFGVVTSAVATLSVTEYIPTPAYIDVDPTNQAVTAGQSAMFSVNAGGDQPIFYQWRRGGSPIANANQSYYVLNATTTNDSGAAFDVVVHNAYGWATSRVAVLTVNPYIPTPPTITAQPQNRSVDEPQPATFSVSAEGDTPMTFRWRQRRTNGTVIVGGSTAEWTIDPTRAIDDGSQLSVVISNVAGVVTSQVAFLTVRPDLPDPAVILTHPADATVEEPGGVAFSVLAGGDAPLHYQWRRNGNLLAGATNETYVLDSTAAALDNGAAFDVMVSNVVNVVTSHVAVLTVTVPPNPQAPSITIHPLDASVQAPAAVSFSVLASGAAPLRYQWRRGGVSISGATGEAYVRGATAYPADNGARFDVVVANAIGAVTSQVATLTVTPAAPPPTAPTIAIHPADLTVIEPTAAGFTVLANGTPPLTYRWRRNGVAITGATGEAYVLNQTDRSDNGARFDVVVTDAHGSLTSDVATLTVLVDPVEAVSLSGTVSYGGAETGMVVVAAYTNAAMRHAPIAFAELSSPGAYVISNLYAGSYYVAAVMLLPPFPDADHIRFSDPWGAYAATTNRVAVPVSAGGSATGIDFVMVDGSRDNPNPFAAPVVTADYDGDGAADPAVFERVAMAWWILQSGNGQLKDGGGIGFGLNSVWPVPGDYDGDGHADLAFFRPVNGTWYVRQSSDDQLMSGGPIQFGGPAATPVPGDYDGDGRMDLAVFFARGGRWYIRQSHDDTLLLGGAIQFGYQATVPVPGDYDGDGQADLAVYLPSSGSWFIRKSSIGLTTFVPPIQFGGPAATPVPGDYDGDGKTDLGVFFRRGGRWNIRLSSTDEQWTGGAIQFGYQATVPVPSDYDGDGRTDLAVYLPGGNRWFIKPDPDGGLMTGAPITFGNPGEPAQVQYQILQAFYGW